MRILVVDDVIDHARAAATAVLDAGHTSVVCTDPWGTNKRGWMPRAVRGHIDATHFSEANFWDEMLLLVHASIRGEKVGILTDLMFSVAQLHGRRPMGIAVATSAAAYGIPVVICTNREDDFRVRAAEEMKRLYKYCQTIPAMAGFNASKNWQSAIDDLQLRSTRRGQLLNVYA